MKKKFDDPLELPLLEPSLFSPILHLRSEKKVFGGDITTYKLREDRKLQGEGMERVCLWNWRSCGSD